MQAGAYTQAAGNVGEGLVFDWCIDLSHGENPTILMLGGSLYLWADLLLCNRNVVFVYRERNTLKYVRRQLKQLLLDKDIVDRQFRTVCRPLESDMSDLAAKASVVAVVGFLHHLSDPRAMLSQLLGTGRPLVVLDTTSELMNNAIAEEVQVRGRAHKDHERCKQAAITVGFNNKVDILKLLEGKDAVRWPQVFEYNLIASWLAAWEGVT